MDKDRLLQIREVPERVSRKGSFKLAEILVSDVEVTNIEFPEIADGLLEVIYETVFYGFINEELVKTFKDTKLLPRKIYDFNTNNKSNRDLVFSSIEDISKEIIDSVRLVGWHSHGSNTLPVKFMEKRYVGDLGVSRILGEEISEEYLVAYEENLQPDKKFGKKKLIRSPVIRDQIIELHDLENLTKQIFGDNFTSIKNYNLNEYGNFLKAILSQNRLFEYEQNAINYRNLYASNDSFSHMRNEFSKKFFETLDNMQKDTKDSYDINDIIYAVLQANSSAAFELDINISIQADYHGYGTGKRR